CMGHKCSAQPNSIRRTRTLKLTTNIGVEAARSDDRRRMQAKNGILTSRSGDPETAVQRPMPNRGGPGEVARAGEDFQVLKRAKREIDWKSAGHRVSESSWIARPGMHVPSDCALFSRCKKHVRVARIQAFDRRSF